MVGLALARCWGEAQYRAGCKAANLLTSNKRSGCEFDNGKQKHPEIEVMKLSDCFAHPDDDPQLEVRCTVYNIGPDSNESLREKSRVLNAYCSFVERTREAMELMAPEDAIDYAIRSCIDDGLLPEFFREHGDEIRKVTMLDYTFETQLANMEAEKDSIIKEQKDMLAQKDDALAQKDSALAQRDDVIAQKDRQIAELMARLEEKQAMPV